MMMAEVVVPFVFGCVVGLLGLTRGLFVWGALNNERLAAYREAAHDFASFLSFLCVEGLCYLFCAAAVTACYVCMLGGILGALLAVALVSCKSMLRWLLEEDGTSFTCLSNMTSK